jgi:hypothetical protein
MKGHKMNDTSLPTRQNLHLAYLLSLAAALLMAAASLAGLFFQTALYPTQALRQSFVSNDVVNLLIGLPILLGSLALARRGRLAGLLFWPGALFYVTYNYLTYAIAMPFTWPCAVYLALVALSLYALVGLLTSLDFPAIKDRLAGAVHERIAGGVLAGLGLLFFVWRCALLAQALAGQAALVGPELAVVVADLLVMPAWVVGGVLLWRRRAFGYAVGAGLLFQGSMLFIGLLVFFVLQPYLASVPFPAADFVVICVMGLVCFVPFGLFWRGI